MINFPFHTLYKLPSHAPFFNQRTSHTYAPSHPYRLFYSFLDSVTFTSLSKVPAPLNAF